MKEPNIQSFLNVYKLKYLVTEDTCFENPGIPSCIDLILFNLKKASTRGTTTFEKGLLQFY